MEAYTFTAVSAPPRHRHPRGPSIEHLEVVVLIGDQQDLVVIAGDVAERCRLAPCRLLKRRAVLESTAVVMHRRSRWWSAPDAP
jgi:hypothetical protein